MSSQKKQEPKKQEPKKQEMVTPRLKTKYRDEIAPSLKQEFGYGSPMAIPKIAMVKVNVGLGEATQNARLVDGVAQDLRECERILSAAKVSKTLTRCSTGFQYVGTVGLLGHSFAMSVRSKLRTRLRIARRRAIRSLVSAPLPQIRGRTLAP